MAKISPLMIAPPAIFLAFAGLFYFGMNRDNPDELPSAIIGREAPAVEITEVGFADPFTSEDLAKGGLKLVNFWASWCGPCRAEHPTLMQLQDEGFEIYGVNYKDQEGQAEAFLEELGDPFFKGGADTNGQMALDWGVYGVPETYLLAEDGTVLLRIAGPLVQRALQERVRPVIEEHLNK